MDTFVKDVSSFAASFSLDWAPREVAEVAVDRVVDSVGCAVGGWDSILDRAARSFAVDSPPDGRSGRLLCEDRYVSADAAAFINTVAVRYLDFNDAYPGGHPSDMIGGLLAVAGGADVSGERFVSAVVVAYEVYTRVSTSVHLLTRAMDQGVGIGFGTVAGVGHMLGLGADAIANALGMMAVSGVPLRASRGGELTNWKGAATAVQVKNAVFFCQMAAEGITGPPAPIHGRHGLAELLGVDVEIPLMPTPGGEFRITGTRLKYWPVAYNMQPAIWAAKGLHGKVDPAEVVEVRLFTDKFAHHESGSEPEKWAPRTRETADHSLPYVVAWTLLRGELDSTSFDESKIGDAELNALMQKITVQVDPAIESDWPTLIQARLEVVDSSGREYVEHVVNPPGHDKNPLSRTDIAAKVTRLARPKLGDEGARGLVDRWFEVASAPSIRDLLSVATPGSPR